VGDGKPVQQPPIEVIGSEDRTLLVVDPVPPGERTMRDLSLEYLKNAADAKDRPKVESVFEVNGGRVPMTDIQWIESGTLRGAFVEFQGEPGLTVPAVYFRPARPTGAQIYVSDDGKAAGIARRVASADNVQFYLDLLGTGELSGIELRYPIYLGRSVPFIGGSTIARAATELKRYGPVEVVAHGPLATLAAIYAGLLDPTLKIKGTDALSEWSDYLSDGVPAAAVQPRAHLLPTLEELRKRLPGSTWEFRAGT
jgi:hypothetical protein